MMENARWVILDMWKMGLLQIPSHLDRKLYYGDCPAGFFLLPSSQGEQLGVPLFKTQQTRRNRSVSVGRNQRCGEYQWPLQRIVETCGPATWA
jgi:hypothetical protein